jgi:hypothetical protein
MTGVLSGYLARWLDDPDGGGYFAGTRNQIRDHDQGCTSLTHAWLPRRGGYSCLSDSMTCDGCGVAFFWEGLDVAFEDCPQSNHWLCACCLTGATTCGCEPQS